MTLFGWGENKEETLGCWKKWVGKIVEKERESEAVAKEGGTVESAEGTMESGFWSSEDLDSGFSLVFLGLGSIVEDEVEDKPFLLFLPLLCSFFVFLKHQMLRSVSQF